MRVVVVGAGIMGAATAWHLARRGADVVVHEQFEEDHARGSSHGRTRIFRLAYPEPEWVALADEALIGWRVLEQEIGAGLLGMHYFIELAPRLELTSHSALGARLISHSIHEPSDLGVTAPLGWIALVQNEAGVVYADDARHAFLDGLDVRYGSRVDDLEALDADVVVVTAGSWVGRFFPDLPLKVTRETVAYFRQEGPQPFPSIVEINGQRSHMMFSLDDPVYGLKVGAHHAGIETDPDDVGEPDPALIERIAAWVAKRLPNADPEPLLTETCLYTTTPDERFILERRGRVVIGSACSGHGFKFAPAVGKRLADLALGH
ncbi:MAG: sarcosine oxidase [Gaiellaceae bacterium]|jgi:sarcosine oxidase|nr:sarcosine oxidase [Gaiellaceae bacterium]